MKEYKQRAGFRVGDLIHIDTDNGEWGRVVSNGEIMALYVKTTLVNAESVRAYIIVPYKDIAKR